LCRPILVKIRTSILPTTIGRSSRGSTWRFPRGKVVAIMGGSAAARRRCCADRRAAQADRRQVLVDGSRCRMGHAELYACAGAWACCSSSARCLPISRFRQRRLPDARAHRSAGRTDPRPGADEAQCGGVCAARTADAGRALRRHGAPRGAGAGDRARSDADHVRRAVCRPRPDLAGRHRPADPQAERCARARRSIMVTHDVQESLQIVDYIYFVSDGKVVARARRTRSAPRPIPSCISSSMPRPTGRCISTIRRRLSAGTAGGVCAWITRLADRAGDQPRRTGRRASGAWALLPLLLMVLVYSGSPSGACI
jgi:hypothetical protein